MIAEILPDWVVAAEAFGDELDRADLFPEEERVIARAVPKRRHEFTAARACARRALAKFGIPPAPILPGRRGAPQWPNGVVGSITHCAGYRAAAVARIADGDSVGIDAEPHDVLPDGVLDQIVSGPDELDRLRQLTAAVPEVHWDRLLFSAKESIYKAWFPLTGEWLGFEDAIVTAAPGGSFTVRLLLPGPLPAGWRMREFQGRWMVRDQLVATAVTVDARAAVL